MAIPFVNTKKWLHFYVIRCDGSIMEKRIRLVKDAHLHIRVDKDDLKRWKTEARRHKMSVTEYAIRKLNEQQSITKSA